MLLEIWPCACSKSVSLHHPCQYKNSNCLKESNLMYYTNHHASGSTNNTLICGMCIYAPCQWTSMCPHEHPTLSGPCTQFVALLSFLTRTTSLAQSSLPAPFTPYRSLFPCPLTYAHPKQQVVWHFHSTKGFYYFLEWKCQTTCCLTFSLQKIIKSFCGRRVMYVPWLTLLSYILVYRSCK